MLCNFCGNQQHHIIAEYTRFEKNNILQCEHCGLVYLHIDKNRETIESFYSNEYRKIAELPVQSAEEHFQDKVTQHDAMDRVQFIANHMDIAGKNILEIGAASGALLAKLTQHGCAQAVGIELGQEFSTYARQNGFSIFNDSIENLNFSNQFDAIVSFHTLEHVYDPKAVIHAIHAALKPGGLFLGEVPNQFDWRIKLFNDKIIQRFHYDPNHLYYFSPITLENYLAGSGFCNIKLETVERYNSIVQLRNIICATNAEKTEDEINKILIKYIFPKEEKDEVRLPSFDDEVTTTFNRIFANAVNHEQMGNCLRWIATRPAG